MVNILIATHGKMASGIKSAVDTIVGLSEGIEIAELTAGMSSDELGNVLSEKISNNSDEGLIIFTDLVSATPYNQAVLKISQSNLTNVYVIGGVSLPMVIEAYNQKLLNTPLTEALDQILHVSSVSVKSWSLNEIANDIDEDDDEF